MTYYLITKIDDDEAERYWIEASSTTDARHLVVMNVPDAPGVTDPTQYLCRADSTKQPPVGFIYRWLSGPVAISKW